MARGVSGSALGNTFDGFLFASVHDDPEAPLSVLSALARLDVDPWEMAAILAKLPKAAAAQQLASMFGNLPGGPSDRETVAARLVSFLPDQSSASSVPTPGEGKRPGTEAGTQATRLMVIYVISTMIMLALMRLEQRQEAAPPGAAAPPAAVGRSASLSPEPAPQ